MPRRPSRKGLLDVDGVILLDKPKGMTSNHVLQRVKYLFKAKKAGHTGSLDPLATGCLPICLGEATKISSYLLDADKHYDTVARLGRTTTTEDAEGETVLERPVELPSREELEQVLQQFRGDLEQVPPMYSALHHEGQRLHKLARKGQIVERAPRKVTISRLELFEMGESSLTLSVSCTKGTYIRSLVRDIGEALGCGAHVEVLRRTGVDPFTTPKMVTLDELHELHRSGESKALLLPVDSALPNWPSVGLDEDQTLRLQNGLKIASEEFGAASRLVRVYGPETKFIGLGEVNDGLLKAKRLMSTAS